MELLVSLRIQLTHLGAQVVGRQLLSNHAKPPQDDSINDLVQLVVQGNKVRTRPCCLDPWREQGQVELGEIDQFGAGVLSCGGLHEAFRQLAVLAIARRQNDEIRGHADECS